MQVHLSRVLSGLSLLFLSACSVFLRNPGDLGATPPQVFYTQFAPEQLAQDLDELFEILEEVHPDLYATTPREEIDQRRAQLVARLERPLTRREFQPLLAELVAVLGDGHTMVYLPQEDWRRAAAEQSFPLDLEWNGVELMVRHHAPAVTEIEVGARIDAIGARPAADLFAQFVARHSGDSVASRVSAAERAFALHLWGEGSAAPFEVTWTSTAQGVTRTAALPGASWSSFEHGRERSTGADWHFSRRADGIAVLALDTFGGASADFARFLRECFGELRKNPASGLIVDLRRNGGGDSRLGDELLHFLADKPWRQSARKEWRMSARYRRYLKGYLAPWLRWLPVQYLHPLGRKLWRTPEGRCAVLEFDLQQPRKEALRFDGPAAFLIGPRTFSSAASLACAVKDFQLGRLVGSSTGGALNGFGEVLSFRLQRTLLTGQVSSARFVRANGDATTHGGVEPDLRVEQELGSQQDTVLERAASELLARRARDN